MRTMKNRALISAVAFLFPAFAAAGPGVILIDAINGNTDVEIQVALDANPEGTTFVLKGIFNFSNPVFLEKSNITIMGDYVDNNGNGKPDETDTWNTVIAGGSPFGFMLSNRDWTPSEISSMPQSCITSSV